jgi:heat-inducible transcriptional repressor
MVETNMNERQQSILIEIVIEYIRKAVPIGSKLVVDNYHEDVSPATVRNDMVKLEEMGYLTQPHTSAGRIPTEDGYRYFIDTRLDYDGFLIKKDIDEMVTGMKDLEIDKEEDNQVRIKKIAKILAEKLNLGVFVAFSSSVVYYTGLANIFSQPEFQNIRSVHNFSSVIDQLDEVMTRIYHHVEDLKVEIGEENRIALDCGTVMFKQEDILFGILGPQRMDYQQSVCYLNFIREILK